MPAAKLGVKVDKQKANTAAICLIVHIASDLIIILKYIK